MDSSIVFRVYLSTALATVATVLVACSPSGGSSGESLESAGVAAYTQYAARCEPGVDNELADTATYFRELDTAPGVSDAYKSAALACFPKLAANCASNIEGCNQLKEIPGTLANGAACRIDNQCQSGSCSREDSQTCGTCAAVPGEGGDCLKMVGTDGTSYSTSACATGLRCKMASGGSGKPTATCVKVVISAAGASCKDGEQCAAGLRCGQGATVNDYICTALVAPGGSCANNGKCDQGGSYGCDATTKTCTPLAKEGSACKKPKDCSAGLVCDVTALVCRKPKSGLAIDAVCGGGDTCVSGSVCTGQPDAGGGAPPPKCQATIAAGATCGTSAARCAEDLYCKTPANGGGIGTCAKRLRAADCK